MTQAIHGQGTLFQVEINSIWETIAEVETISGPELKVDSIDVTSHDSPHGYKESIPGLKEGGTVKIDGNLVPYHVTHTRLIGDITNGTQRNYRIVFPDAVELDTRTKCSFLGHIEAFSASAPASKQLGFSATIKIDGEPVWETTQAPDLTALTVNNGTLTPEFSSTTYNYGVSVPNSVTSLAITPTCAAADRITVNDVTVASGSASSAISLSVGANVIVIKTYKEGATSKTYTIYVVRAAA